jgi:large subunit ribosomal protein L4
MKHPEAPVYNMDGEVVRQEALDPYVFDARINQPLVHQVVTAQLLNRRQGNASTKTRGEVSGGNKKPYRQKGTGHARQGSTRAPHFVGGGTVFGPKPHPYEAKVPRKMRRGAIRAVLTDKALSGRLILMDELAFEEPSTNAMKEFIEKLPIDRNVLILLPKRNNNVILSGRNLSVVRVGNVEALNVVEILKYDRLILPMKSMRLIVARFGRDADDRLDAKRHPRLLERRLAGRAAGAAGSAAGSATAARA